MGRGKESWGTRYVKGFFLGWKYKEEYSRFSRNEEWARVGKICHGFHI